MFITFEGLDFCGKSTQVELLKNYFEASEKKVEIIREPGGTEISEKIRDILLDKKNTEMTIESELLLFSSSRAQLVREKIIPLLEKGYYVISDRFHDSSIAYQGYGRGISINSVKEIQYFAINGAIPNITFFIDVPFEEISRRRLNHGENNLDRIELSENEFYRNVYRGYLELCEAEDRIKKIDGTKSIEEVHQQIINEIKTLENLERK
ncbi:MAG: dTMP kinase [Bacteroidota bacterium]